MITIVNKAKIESNTQHSMFKHILENLNGLRQEKKPTHRKSSIFDIESSSEAQTSKNLFSDKTTKAKMMRVIEKLKGGDYGL